MGTGRIEAFSDGVIAIIVTIMVLELKVPANATAAALIAVTPMFLVYALSFLTVAIMWVNHHHYLKTARHADSALLWANNNLLFWMSLIPYATRYLGQNIGAPLPLTLYGGLLAVTSTSFFWVICILEAHNADRPVIAAEYRHLRGKSLMTVAIYVACAALSWYSAPASLTIMALMPGIYFLPQRRLVGGDA